MVDTIDDLDPPYRSGDSDKAERKIAWPSVEEAKKRIELRIDDVPDASGVAIKVADLIAVMRELGRLTAENNELRAALAAEPASGEMVKGPNSPQKVPQYLKLRGDI